MIFSGLCGWFPEGDLCPTCCGTWVSSSSSCAQDIVAAIDRLQVYYSPLELQRWVADHDLVAVQDLVQTAEYPCNNWWIWVWAWVKTNTRAIFFFAAVFFLVPGSMLSCFWFSDFLLLCFSAFLLPAFLLSCFSAFLLLLLLFLLFCFSAFLLLCFYAFAFPAFLLLCFSASLRFCSLLSLLLCFFASLPSLLLLLFCFCASVPFYFYYSTSSFFRHVFLCYTSCSFALLIVFTLSSFFILFCFILSCLYPK